MSSAKAKAPTLWGFLEFRVVGGSGSNDHAEDIAMLYAIEAGALKGNANFPDGSKIAAWGKVKGMRTDDRTRPCSDGNILPSCTETIGDMNIDSAYDDSI